MSKKRGRERKKNGKKGKREEEEWKEREERGRRMEGEHEEMKRSSLIQSVLSLSPLLSSHEYS